MSAGTDPLLDESLALEVRDFYSTVSLYSVSAYHEESISDERPYSYRLEELPAPDASFYTDRSTHIITIDIDESGNGTFSDSFQYRGAADRDIAIENQESTRTRTDSSILWVGTNAYSNSGASVGDDIEFSIETSLQSDLNIKQEGTISRQNRGMSSGDYEQELVYSLIGNRLDDSVTCQVVSGTLTNELSYSRCTKNSSRYGDYCLQRE